MSREPLLADHILAEKSNGVTFRYMNDRFVDSLKAHIREAKRFVLDEQAAVYVAEMLVKAPRIIADAQDFAIAPFENMWVELPYKGFFHTMTKPLIEMGVPVKPYEGGGLSDETVGYLYAGLNCYSFGGGGPNGQVGLVPFVVQRNQPWSVQDEYDFTTRAKLSRAQLDVMFWGSSYELLRAEQDKEGLRALRANHSMRFFDDREMRKVPPLERERLQAILGGAAETCYGDVRNVIALLLFLNRTSKLQVIKEIGMAPKVMHRQSVRLLAHSVITLPLDPVPKLLKLVAGEGVWRRLHDVRGHFCHNKEARENPHEHEWVDTSDQKGGHALQWRCACGGLRWWRSEHERGHKEKGHVASEYEVTK